jgi:DNA mismatch repair protein MSH3
VIELERHLETHELAEVRRVLREPTLNFRHQSAGTAGREEYFIELAHGSAAARRVPNDWLRVSQTKGVVRFRPPTVEAQLRLLALAREAREGQARSAWLAVQRAAAPWMQALRGLTGRLAQLDTLLCLAGLARRHGYVRPILLPADGSPATLHATESRHPLIEAYRQSNGLPYVPNDVRLGGGAAAALPATPNDPLPPGAAAPNGGPGCSAAIPRCAILMGPNMGGKSSYCRQVGTLALLAQVGSFVPAGSCVLTPFRWLASRMGARDSLARGVSTFELELGQTAEALSFADGRGGASGLSGIGERSLRASGVETAPSRSLLLLDEVGRGTATHDGAAIAHAVLEHITDSGALCVFTTHHPEVADLATARPKDVAVFHMDAIVASPKCGARGCTDAIAPDVQMLHRLAPGTGDGSYGIHVGRLAGLPPQVLAAAAAESDQMRRRLRAEASKRKESDLERLVMHAIWLERIGGTAQQGLGTKMIWQLQQDMRCA